MGPPTGRKTRWGKAGTPQQGGLPEAQRRVSTSKAEAAPAVAEGQHDSSGGVPAAVRALVREGIITVNNSYGKKMLL